MAGATSIARATAAFSKKNARFFAGYAFDAKQVPFAWTPPGRVFVGIELERAALLDEDGVQEGRGRWGGFVDVARRRSGAPRRGRTRWRRCRDEVRGSLGTDGIGALTLVGERGPVVVPTRWRADEHALYAALPGETLSLAAAGPDAPAALTVDEASAWRARDMVGAMVQGTGICLRARRARQRVEVGSDASRPGSTRMPRRWYGSTPSRLVWWRGWTSGSAEVG